jgi:cyclopropane fatty-acyl-phospholipid synthase-like methyltransferase
MPMSYYYTYMSRLIIEKILGISGDYQYRAIHSRNWIQRYWHKNKFDALSLLMKKGKDKNVLDLGTGSGNFEFIFASKFEKIIGVDYNQEALSFINQQITERKLRNIKLIKSDIRRLSHEVTKKKYDYVILIDVIEHIRIQEINILLTNIRTILKKGGQIIVITPNYKSVWQLFETISDGLSILPKLSLKQHLTKLDPQIISELFFNNGYKRIRVKSFNLFSFVSPFPKLNNILLKFELKMKVKLGCLVFASGVKI